MDTPSFDWALVASFLAVLDEGSLSAAARRRGVHQPTLSRHIAELEEQLGAPLFERTGRGMAPTRAALAIAPSARAMQQGAEALGVAVAGQRAQVAGTVRVTTSHIAATYLLPRVVVGLRRAHPHITLEVVASDALTNLLRREADIAVRLVRPAQGSLVARKVAELQVVACAHRRYLKAAGVPRRPEELLEHQLVGFDRDDSIVRGAEAAGLPLTREHFGLRTDDLVAYGRLIQAGAGIGFVARYNLAHLPGVEVVLPELALPALPVWLAVHREIHGNPLVRAVYDHLATALPLELARLEGRVQTAEIPQARRA